MNNMKSQTNFEKVVEFNEQFGITTFDTPQHTIFDDDPKLVELRMNLIREEVNELEDAVKDKDYTETVDALSDILYVVYGMGSSIGINLDKAFALVHESNMSKLCNNEEEAKETVKWYETEFAEKRLPYDSPDYRKSTCGTYWVVYNASTGKILKSIRYKPVDFKSLLEK